MNISTSNTFNDLDIGQIYDTYFSQIYHFIFSQVLHKELAEDIASDSFLKVINSLDTFDSAKASLRTWIFRIAHHTLIDYYRTHKIHMNLEYQINFLRVQFETQYEQITNDTCKELYRLLAQLSDRSKTILHLKYFNNMSNREIAAITGMNASTVSTLHQRALLSLRKKADLSLLSCFTLYF